ncbi:hypothetical protein BVY04_01475 [bacterium M21]|nr:hypothetical protein BVY04_01475 [bacterium M21]
MSAKEHELDVPGFWGKSVSHLTAIIGENGAGKTTLLRFLADILTHGKNSDHEYRRGKGFLLIEHGGEIVLYDPGYLAVTDSSLTRIDADELCEIRKQLELIYFSSHFNPMSLSQRTEVDTQWAGFKNLSASQAFAEDIRKYQPDKCGQPTCRFSTNAIGFVTHHASQELQKQVRAIHFFQTEDFPMKLPRFLHISVNREGLRWAKQDKRARELGLDWLADKKKGLNAKQAFLWELFCSGLCSLAKSSNIVTNDPPDWELIAGELKNFTGIQEDKTEIGLFDLQEHATLWGILACEVRLLIDTIDCVAKFTDYLSSTGSHGILAIPFDDNRILEAGISLIDKDSRIWMENVHFLNFEFSQDPIKRTTLSSGEFALLTLCSRIHAYSQEAGRGEGQTVLMLDEAELAFHPEWQRRYVKLIVDLFEYLFPQGGQIVICTHSPLILSDIPKHCVVYLGGKHEEQTFGANIHSLYANSFCLPGGLIGAFAEDKIQTVIREIQGLAPDCSQQEQSRREYDHDSGMWHPNAIEKQIKMIGEPFMQRKLWELYESKLLKNGRSLLRENRIRSLRSELKELENQNLENES